MATALFLTAGPLALCLPFAAHFVAEIVRSERARGGGR